ncbi:hypothetical protein PoB_003638800 [Plakobranchus ocellatus]|uniref:Uncharacterized protein n=1 Tax=Plakobranchus ocellatus TaxID=259542 RepID=A0AAV4ATJ5_9GAST|nr:hypothetical protein PoB_003638800 [Plakobranchus ocellatus]
MNFLIINISVTALTGYRSSPPITPPTTSRKVITSGRFPRTRTMRRESESWSGGQAPTNLVGHCPPCPLRRAAVDKRDQIDQALVSGPLTLSQGKIKYVLATLPGTSLPRDLNPRRDTL